MIRITVSNQTAKKIAQLEARAKRTGDYRLLRRIGAIRALLDGIAVSVIAKSLCCSEQTIRNWWHKFVSQGVESLKFGRSPGRPASLTKTQRKELIKKIEEGPLEAGYLSACWTSIIIVDLIAREFKVIYSRYYVCQLLNQLGFSYQKAKFVSDHLNEEAREKWTSETWPEILAAAQTNQAKIMFGDEATCAMWGSLGRTWSRKGEQPTVKTSGKRKGYKIFGLMEYFTGQIYTQAITERFNSDSYIEFLEQVLEQTVGQIILIQDGARYHTSKKCKAFFAQTKRLTVYQLPSYSPDFNPIERFWKKLKGYATHNHYFQKFEDLVETVDKALVWFASIPSELLSLMAHYCTSLGEEL